MDEMRVYQIVGPNDAPLREPRELYARYSTLFPECRLCGDLADGSDGLCSKDASDLEWQQQRAAKRAAWGG